MSATNSHQRVTHQDILNSQWPIPSLPEQRAIADYLDHATARIDRLVDAQERLIAALRERRTATIAHAVTRGLDSHAKLKESGVEWTGDIPQTWSVQRLKNCIASTQVGAWGAEPDGGPDDVHVVRVADFDRHRRVVDFDVPTTRSITKSEQERRLLRRGDLLLEKSGGTDQNPVGFVVMFNADYPAVTSNFVARIRLRNEHYSKYWLYAHAASYETKLTQRSVKRTTGIQNLDQGSYFNELFPYPPLAEQCAIADYIDRETAKIDELINQAERFIVLAKERRSALITAAVTGQFDVRTAGKVPA